MVNDLLYNYDKNNNICYNYQFFKWLINKKIDKIKIYMQCYLT